MLTLIVEFVSSRLVYFLFFGDDAWDGGDVDAGGGYERVWVFVPVGFLKSIANGLKAEACNETTANDVCYTHLVVFIFNICAQMIFFSLSLPPS